MVANKVGGYRDAFQLCDASTYMLIKFWRPVVPMKKPVESKPLCTILSTEDGWQAEQPTGHMCNIYEKPTSHPHPQTG